MKTIPLPRLGEESAGGHQEKLALLLKLKDTMLENMRLGNEHIHLRSEIDRLKIIVEFLMKRITRCRCNTRG